MNESLAGMIERYVLRHGGGPGTVRTAVPGLSLICAKTPSEIDHAISSPLVALVAQGRKDVWLGSQRVSMAGGDILLITADIPTVSRITEASPQTPYCSFVLDLDAKVIAELSDALPQPPRDAGPALTSMPAGVTLQDAALRLVGLLDSPEDRAILAPQILRELHYRLLQGPQGPAIRRLGFANGHEARIGRAVERLRRDFASPLRIGDLARDAGMSLSSFHHHFRAVTTLTPLQFQKQLRLIEARQRMLGQGLTAAAAAYSVGYESVPQFTREYGRLFGAPPARDVQGLRHAAVA